MLQQGYIRFSKVISDLGTRLGRCQRHWYHYDGHEDDDGDDDDNNDNNDDDNNDNDQPSAVHGRKETSRAAGALRPERLKAKILLMG